MIATKLAMLVLVIGVSISVPKVSIEITKSSFLFLIKWVNFTPINVISADKTFPGGAGSKWYIFADYFGKLQAKEPELKTSVQYKINDAKEYKDLSVLEIVNSEDKITIALPSFEADCKADEKFISNVENVELVENIFKVSLDVKCTHVNAVSDIKEGLALIQNGNKVAAQALENVVNQEQVLNNAIENRIDLGKAIQNIKRVL